MMVGLGVAVRSERGGFLRFPPEIGDEMRPAHVVGDSALEIDAGRVSFVGEG
jgi:hypothetical protein